MTPFDYTARQEADYQAEGERLRELDDAARHVPAPELASETGHRRVVGWRTYRHPTLGGLCQEPVYAEDARC